MKRDLAPWAMFFAAGMVAAIAILSGCTAEQRKIDSAAIAKFEAKLKADGQKAEVILGAIAANGGQIVACSGSVVASTALAISTGDVLGLLSGWACIVPAAIKLRADIKAGLAKLPALDAVQLAQQVHAAAEIAKQIVAPILAPPPVPLPPPGLPAPLINP